MAIRAKCGSCNAKFTAKDALAGKKIKCPKCNDSLVIPMKSAPKKQVAAAAAPQTHNPLLDLLDEAGVESMPRGPICEQCGAEVAADAIICVQCGYNMATGATIETTVYAEDNPDVVGMTDAEKIMAKAEQEIDDMPVSSYGQDFGDGADSILIAGVSLFFLAVLVAIGVGTIFVMDKVGEVIDSSVISFWAGTALTICMMLWITIVAFMSKKSQGLICVCTLGLYCIIFGFMQGRALIIPTIILLAAMFIAFVSSFFAFAQDDGFGLLMLARNLA